MEAITRTAATAGARDAGWLIGRNASNREELQAFTARAVTALDPCVRWELEWL